MACTFPTYSDITGAQIIAVIAPRTSLGSYDADAIDFDKTSNTTNSIIGLCVDEFNDWFIDIGVTIADVSSSDCSKITLALKLYIAGRYLEADKKLTSSDGDFYPYQDVKHLFDRACVLIRDTEANISGVASFCSYGVNTIAENWDSEGFTKYKPDSENFSSGLPPREQKARHIDLLGLLEDHHTQYLTSTRGDIRYYTKSQVDGLLDGLVSDHGELTGLADDDHPQYHNDARGDARYYTQTYIDANFAVLSHTHDDRYYTESESDSRFSSIVHTHDDRYYTETEIDGLLASKSDTGHAHTWIEITGKPTFGAVATSNSYDDLDDLPTLFSGNYGDLSGTPDLTQYLESVVSGTNITVDNTDPQNPTISATGATPAGSSDGDIQYKSGSNLGATSGFNFASNNLSLPSGGAFKIGSSDALKYSESNLNTYVGKNLGNSTGYFNVFVGDNAGDGSTGTKIIGIGRNAGKNSSQSLIAIGDNSGGGNASGITGFGNTMIGDRSGRDTTSGYENTFIGIFTGQNNNTGFWNTYIGPYAGRNGTTANNNTFIGPFCGFRITTGSFNTAFGPYAHINLLDGNNNTAIGLESFTALVSGERNFGAGRYTGWLSLGDDNTYIGDSAGKYNQNGVENVMIGAGAGQNEGSIYSSDGCVFIGYQAGATETGSNKLYISNSNTSSPLIYGEFNNSLLRINGEIETTDHLTLAEITTPTAVADKGKIYTKSDNKLYFQDGAGTEHEIQFV